MAVTPAGPPPAMFRWHLPARRRARASSPPTIVAVVVEGAEGTCSVQGSAVWHTFSNACDEWRGRDEAMRAVGIALGTDLAWRQLGPRTWAASVARDGLVGASA